MKGISFFEHLAKGIGHEAKAVAPVAAGLAVSMATGGMISPTMTEQALAVLNFSKGGTMETAQLSMLEQFAINMIFGVLQATVKNPAHAAVLKTQLVGVANDIFMTYGMIPPAPSADQPQPH